MGIQGIFNKLLRKRRYTHHKMDGSWLADFPSLQHTMQIVGANGLECVAFLIVIISQDLKGSDQQNKSTHNEFQKLLSSPRNPRKTYMKIARIQSANT